MLSLKVSRMVDISFEVIVVGVVDCGFGEEDGDGEEVNCWWVTQLSEHWQEVSLQKSESWKGCGDG